MRERLIALTLASCLALAALLPSGAEAAAKKKKPKAKPAATAPASPTGAKAAQPAEAKVEPAVPAVAPPAVPAADSVDPAAVAKAVQGFYERTSAFQARFVQVVKKKGLSKGLQREGVVYLTKGDAAKPGKMRWDYPTEEIFYFSDGEVLWSYERKERLAVRVPVKNSQVAQATTWLTGQGNLAENFTLTLVPSSVADTWALKLVPKQGTQTMRSLTLVVDKKTAAVRATVLEDPLGDSTTLQWLDPKYDAIDDKVFAWSPPPGVTIKNL
ncbi:MAG: LolA family protein [Myxococcota bacterium]